MHILIEVPHLFVHNIVINYSLTHYLPSLHLRECCSLLSFAGNRILILLIIISDIYFLYNFRLYVFCNYTLYLYKSIWTSITFKCNMQIIYIHMWRNTNEGQWINILGKSLYVFNICIYSICWVCNLSLQCISRSNLRRIIC